MLEKAAEIIELHRRLEAELAEAAEQNDNKKLAELGKQLSLMDEKYQVAEQLIRNDQALREAEEMKADPDMREMVEEEMQNLNHEKVQLEADFKKALVPKDPRDHKNIVIEMRAGTGGDESSLFVGELMRAYLKYCEENGLKSQIISESPGTAGGYKEVIFEIRGDKPYSHFKFEAGVHRVQRVPETEAKGRVHTSTITVAVIPEVDEVDIHIDPSDLRIDTFRASGAGGQHVNTTDSAVRITHIPTGTVSECQSGRSQHTNKDKAMQMLRSRIVQKIEEDKAAKEVAERKSMIGAGTRSEKIRTYNFPQDRITDHRIGQNFSNIKDVMEGNIGKLFQALQAEEEKRMMSEG